MDRDAADGLDSRSRAWRRWLGAEPPVGMVTVFFVLIILVVAGDLAASQELCGDRADECRLLHFGSVGALGVVVAVFAPWVAAWTALRGARARSAMVEGRFAPELANLRLMFAQGLVDEGDYEAERRRLRGFMDGSGAHAAITVGGIAAGTGVLWVVAAALVSTGLGFFLVESENDAAAAIAVPVGLVGIVIGVVVAVGGVVTRAAGRRALQRTLQEAEHHADQLVLRVREVARSGKTGETRSRATRVAQRGTK